MNEPQCRRQSPRSLIHLPVLIKMPDESAARPVRLRDISAGGISAFLDADIGVSTPIEVIVSVPYEISLTKMIDVHLQGSVMRVDCTEVTSERTVAARLLFPSPPGQA